MIVVQNDSNRFQFTVILENELIEDVDKVFGSECSMFDGLPGSYKDREKVLADVIITGLIEAYKQFVED